MSDQARPPRSVPSRAWLALRERAEAEDRRGDFRTSAAIWRELADEGDGHACQVLGDRYEAGQGVGQNFIKAAAWFRKAADQGLAHAQAKLGEIYFFGRSSAHRTHDHSVEQDYRAAAWWNLMAADAGDLGAQVRWAYQCAAGLGLDHDYAEAELWFTRAAEKGHIGAAFGLGLLHVGGHARESDLADAARWFELAVKGGHAGAKLSLALLYLRGEGVKANPSRAAALIREASESGGGEPMYVWSDRVPPNAKVSGDHEGQSWLDRAAARGHAKSMVCVAMLLLEHSEGDAATAAVCLRRAAELGEAEAQVALGRLYLEGRGLPCDPREAAWWFETAAAQGDCGACEQLGALCAEGLGVERNYVAARRWFRKAAEAGSPTALERLRALSDAPSWGPGDGLRI